MTLFGCLDRAGRGAMAALLGALFLVAAAPAAADFQDGLKAYQQGDYSAAVRLLKIPAREKDARAQYLLGMLYRDGLGTDVNPKRAFHWISESAEMGLPRSQSELGGFYLRGFGTKQSDKKAVKWLKKAAKYGDATGQRLYGQLLFEGRGTKPNRVAAYKWMQLAEVQGDPLAAKLRAEYGTVMGAEEIALAKQKAADYEASAANWQPQREVGLQNISRGGAPSQ